MRASTLAGPTRRFQAAARSFFRVEPGERSPVAIMMVYSAAAVGGALTVGYGGVSQALFFSRLPASDVPFTLILPAVSIVLTLLLYNRLASRFRLPPLAVASAALLMLAGLVLWILLISGYGKSFGVVAAIFLYCETAASITILQFWTFAAQIFDPRQARRLFGLIAAGGTASSVIAGISLALLVQFIGVDNLLLIVAGSVGACGACALLLRKRIPRSVAPDRKGVGGAMDRRNDGPAGASLLRDIGAIWHSPLLRAIAGITVLVSLLINIGAYQFFLALQVHYAGHGAALAEFLGAFAVYTGLAALAVQLFVTGAVMRRFGFLVAQACFPLAMVVTGGASLIALGPLWAVTLTRACDPVARRTIHDASLNALYLPVPPELRARARTVLEISYAAAFGLAGAIFLLVQHAAPDWTYPYWSIPVFVLAACWLALLLWTRPQYVRALVEGVKRRRLNFTDGVLDFTDETAAQVLLRALRSTDDRQVVHVLRLLAEAPDVRWHSHVAGMLSHDSPQVRIAALHYLARASEPSTFGEIASLLNAEEDEVRGAAVDALFTVDRARAISPTASRLDDSGARTVSAVVAGLIAAGDAEQALRAAERLRLMLGSDQPAMRRAGADALGALAGCALDEPLLSLLADLANASPAHVPDKSTAVSAVPVKLLVTLLGNAATRASAADALTRYRQDAVSVLGTLLRDPARASAARVEASRILQRIGGAAAVQTLLDHLVEGDERVRASVYRSLAQLRSSGTDIPFDAAALDGRIAAEIRECYERHVLRADMQAQDVDSLLDDAVRERIERAVDRVFLLLEIRYPVQGLAWARRAIAGADRAARAMAVELLDNLLERATGELLLPLLEAPIDRLVEIGGTRLGIQRRSHVERLQQLGASGDRWLQACALHRIGTLRASALAPVVVAAMTSDDIVVRETALAAVRRFGESTHAATRLSAQADEQRVSGVHPHAGGLTQNGGGDAADD